MTPASLTAVARRLSFVRETDGANRGAWVEKFQRDAGGVPGDSWCAQFVSFVLDVAYRGRSPLRPTGSCQAMLNEARLKKWEVLTATQEALYFFVNDAGHAHHVGIVTNIDPLYGIAGNTSPDGASSNGTGVFEHPLTVPASKVVFVELRDA